MPNGPYAQAALYYLAGGWEGVLPIGPGPNKKAYPPDGFTGKEGVYPCVTQIEDWLSNDWAVCNIALRLHEDLVGIDTDDYGGKVGEATMRAVEAVHGPLPATWRSTARDPGQHRGISMFRIEPGSITKGYVINHADGKSDVEIIRYGHRYMLVYPSINPLTGTEYRWYDPTGKVGVPAIPDDDDDVVADHPFPFLPQGWVDHIEKTCECFAPRRGAKEPFIRVERDRSPEHARDEAIRYCKAGSSVHDLVLAPVLTLCWYRNRGHPRAPQMLDEVKVEFVAEVTRPWRGMVRTIAEAEGEWKRMTEEGDASTTGRAEPPWTEKAVADASGGAATALNLPPEFWDARPALKRIRDAAWSRQRSPDAVLAGVLTRVAASIDHQIAIPPIVGSPAGTALLVAVVSPSGVGKTTGASIADELVTTSIDVKTITGGTGEGMVEAYFDMVEITDPATNKPKRVRKQAHRNLHIYVDEVTKTISVGKRDGSTVFEMLRQAFSGSALGEHNASAERRRVIAQGEYSIGVLMAAQPHVLGPLFDDVDAGTPSRFLYLIGTDESVPESPPAWPGLIDASLPSSWNVTLTGNGSGVRVGGAWPYHAIVADEIMREVRARDLIKVRGHGDGNPWNGHRDLIRLKVALVLAILDHRVKVRVDDWALAGMVVDTSDAVRRHAQGVVAAVSARRQASASRRQGERTVIVAGMVEENAVLRLARRITRHVLAEPGVLSPGEAKRRLESGARSLGDDAIEKATALGWIEERVEPSRTGSDKTRLWPGPTAMPK